MAKKKVEQVSVNDDMLTRGMPQPKKRPGGQAKEPANLAEALDDVESRSRAWIKRYHDVWFSTATIPILETASNSLTYDGIPERYARVIEVLEALADRAAGAIAGLKVGEARAKKQRAREQASRGKTRSTKK
jgi:hypothetical protein